MKPSVPRPAIMRLCSLYRVLAELSADTARQCISSTELGELLGSGSHNIRKDINYLGEVGRIGSGYDIRLLKAHIAEKLQLATPRNTCVVGLGRLGSAMLSYEGFAATPFQIVAGFDSNINRLETIRTAVPLFPAFEIPEVVSRAAIEIAILTVPAAAAQECAERLIEGGIRGIVNFTARNIRCGHRGVKVIDIDVLRELTILSTLMTLDA